MGNFTFILEGDINVRTMQKQSGIYLGEKNTNIGLSAHSKVNGVFSGIGGQSNIFLRNLSILNDQDIIDSPINDNDINIHTKNQDEETHNNILLRAINVSAMTQNSSVFVGDGTVTGMDANEKANHAMGGAFGNANLKYQNINLNNDQDLIDGNIFDQDIKIARMNKGSDPLCPRRTIHGKIDL